MQRNIIFTSIAFVFFFLEQYSGSISLVFTLSEGRVAESLQVHVKSGSQSTFLLIFPLLYFLQINQLSAQVGLVSTLHQNDIFKRKYVSLKGQELRVQRGEIETSAGMCRFHLSFFYVNRRLYTTAQRDYVFNSIIVSGISQGPDQKSPYSDSLIFRVISPRMKYSLVGRIN